jgi:hypothetical protein
VRGATSIRHLVCVVLVGEKLERGRQNGRRAHEGAAAAWEAVEALALGSLLSLAFYFFTSLAFPA